MEKTIDVAGEVIRWNPKGFGFIQCHDARVRADVFALGSAFAAKPFVGMRVRMKAYRGPKGWRADEVVETP